MPSVSQNQRAAMFAAAAGKSDLGIPQRVGEEYAEADKGGKLPEKVAKDRRAVIDQLRGYGIDNGLLDKLMLALGIFDIAEGRNAKKDYPPFRNGRPLEKWEMPGPEDGEEEEESFSEDCRMARDSIAFDRASLRSYDESGHLRVERTPISRANVCGYLGSEIPDEDGSLRLDPQKEYRLYRDAAALKDAASSFAGKPILLKHEPISADDHPRDLVVGAIGEPVEFDGDWLTAPITIWDKEAIEAINNGKLKGLSAGYFYSPSMQSGVAPNGERYDGKMVDIQANHLALVETPRIEGAYVADSAEERQWAAIEAAIVALDEALYEQMKAREAEKAKKPVSRAKR